MKNSWKSNNIQELLLPRFHRFQFSVSSYLPIIPRIICFISSRKEAGCSTIAEGLKEDDNPVLMVVKFKE
jgi:hypothetical protein